MSKKAFVIIAILSVVVTYGAAIVDFAFNISIGSLGLPFGFSRFNFLGAETDGTMLLLDILFWFVVIFISWKLILKFFKR